MLGKPLLHPGDPNIVGVATDSPAGLFTGLPVFDLQNAGGIATFVAERAAAWPIDD
jgi:hypothetical protein